MGSFMGFDFEPNFDFDFKNMNIKKSFLDTVKSKSFKRFIKIIIAIGIFILAMYFLFLALDISMQLETVVLDDGSTSIEAMPVSPYMNDIMTSVIILMLPAGVVLILALMLRRYKKIDNAYFEANKKRCVGKVVVVPNRKKFKRSTIFFLCIEMLIDEEEKKEIFKNLPQNNIKNNSKKNKKKDSVEFKEGALYALVEVPYLVEIDEPMLEVDYLARTNEARFVRYIE